MKIDKCRLCKGKLSEPKIKFPATPLANEFLKTPEPQEMFPLEICVCESCEHYQLNESVNPERLFRNYLFVAGTSAVNVEHFRQYAIHMVEMFNLQPGDKVLDIASNDGVLLKEFLNLKMSVLGIDPAVNIAVEATKSGIPTIPEFFTEERANIMLKKHEKFKLITANNVFAHVSDLADFTKGVKKLLKPDGIFSFEVSYFGDVVDKILFDTIYHEHSSYHTITPLIQFFYQHNMELFRVEHISNHGGSIRCFVRHLGDMTDYESSVDLLKMSESDIGRRVANLSINIRILGLELREKLRNLKSQGKTIAIYGTPAKATTLMYALGIDESMIDFAVDDAPLKQGTFTPGKHILVLPPSNIYSKNPDCLLVLAWNFADSIMKNHSAFKGKWIVPIPQLKEY